MISICRVVGKYGLTEVGDVDMCVDFRCGD